MSTIITAIDRHSPAERAGVQVGEQLLSINGHPIVDVLDYKFFSYDTRLELVLREEDGSTRTVRPQGRRPGPGAELRHVSDGRNALLCQSLLVLLCGPDAAGYALHAVLQG